VATILQFAERLADGQDWTAAERAQLRDVGAQLAGVDVVFGKSDAGEPWCVVTDEGGEVMLHVARIGGDFVVHSAEEDEVVLDEDLWTAARRLLGDVLKDRRGVLVAFPPDMLGHTAVLAFLFAAALRGEFDHWIPREDFAADLPEDAHAPAATGLPEAAQAPAEHHRRQPAAEDDHDAGQGAVTKEAAPAERADARAPASAHAATAQKAEVAPAHLEAANDRGPAPPAPATTPATARTEGGQTISNAFAGANSGGTSGAGGSSSSGEGAATTTDTPKAPLTEFVQGGDGDDRIQMHETTAATGGKGADAFVVTLPVVAAHGAAPQLMGVVGDFRIAEGDRIEVTGGRGTMVVDRDEADILAAIRPRPGSGDAPVVAGRHMGWDTDGDGREDAYVLVTDKGGTWFTPAGRGVVQDGPAPMPSPANVGSAPVIEAAAGHVVAAEGPHAPIGLTVAAHPPTGEVGC
jgi:hypothetical protein